MLGGRGRSRINRNGPRALLTRGYLAANLEVGDAENTQDRDPLFVADGPVSGDRMALISTVFSIRPDVKSDVSKYTFYSRTKLDWESF